MGEVMADVVEWETEGFIRKALKLTFGASIIDSLKSDLVSRVSNNLPLTLKSASKIVTFMPATSFHWEIKGPGVIVHLSKETAASLAASIEARHGEYSVPGLDRFTVRVVRSEIKDSEGQVVKVVG